MRATLIVLVFSAITVTGCSRKADQPPGQIDKPLIDASAATGATGASGASGSSGDFGNLTNTYRKVQSDAAAAAHDADAARNREKGTE